MSDLITGELAERIAKTHARLLEIVADLSEGQLHWRPGAHAPSIAFHLAAYLLLVHLAHAARHLGMIEALRGVQGLRGTATV